MISVMTKKKFFKNHYSKIMLMLLKMLKTFFYFVFLFRIGQCISTKAVGKFEREDITDDYKHDESKLYFQFIFRK